MTAVNLAVTEQEIHEAGHAVAHLSFGHNIAEVTANHCKLAATDVLVDRETVRGLMERESEQQQAIALCCGKAAMDRFFGWKAKDETNWRASSDYRQAHAIALRQSANDSLGAQHLMAYYERMAELLIEKRWDQVTKLACVLENKQRLDGREIAEVLDKHM